MVATNVFCRIDNSWVNGFGPSYPYLDDGSPAMFSYQSEDTPRQDPIVESYFGRAVSPAEVENFCSMFLASIFEIITRQDSGLILPQSTIVTGGDGFDFGTGTFTNQVA